MSGELDITYDGTTANFPPTSSMNGISQDKYNKIFNDKNRKKYEVWKEKVGLGKTEPDTDYIENMMGKCK